MGDHEYEPIQAPAQRAASQPDVRSVHIEGIVHHTERPSHRHEEAQKHDEEERYEVVKPKPTAQPEEVITLLQTESGYEAIEQPKKHPRRFIKIPNEDAIIIPLHGSSDEDINPDRYNNPALMVSEDELDSPQKGMPSIQVHPPESSSKEETPQTQETFQGKLRSQAERFRTKLKGISKPKISLPQRPKMKLPERPNIKMPEMPKIKLPNKPKFNLPERPKFHFPDRPKFHIPEKPKFLTERPKFKFGTEKKPKPAKGKKPNPSSLRRPLRDVVTVSSQSTPGSTQNIFESLKFRTYPRFFKKKKKEQLEQKMSSFDTESSPSTPPPPRPKTHAPHQDTEWVTTYRGLQYADEDEDEDVGPRGERFSIPDYESKEERSSPFQERYLEKATNVKASVAQAESMNSVASEKGSSGSSSVRRRAGVIEEIDSDEFFVRQKGLSREDVDVSRYLSLEIRDAFRQPKNALASLDNDLYDEEEPEIRFSEIPRAPQRKKSITKSVGSETEKEFHTFPKRPSRRKESDPEKPPRRFRSRSGGRLKSRQSSMPSLEANLDATPEVPQRRKSTKSLNRDQAAEDEDIVQTRETARNSSSEIAPVAPLRKFRSRGTSLADDDRTSRGADSAILQDDDDDVEDHLAQGIERVNINADDDIKVEELLDDEVEEKGRDYVRAEPARVEESVMKVPEAELPGYAVVAKDKKKPGRPPLPPRAHHFDFHSQLDTIKTTGKNIFFTYPRRAIKSLQKPPARPSRNYSTLGPLRPPRRNRVFRQPVYMKGDSQGLSEEMIEKERDLQSGEIVMKMKGRPLPPPPRPPRRSRDYDILAEIEKAESIPTESETIVSAVETEIMTEAGGYGTKERTSYLKSKKDEFFNSLSRFKPFRSQREAEDPKEEMTQTGEDCLTTTSQQTSFDMAEVSVSIQTDPLPKDVIVIDQEIEETQEIFIVDDKPLRREEEDKSESGKKTPAVDETKDHPSREEESVLELQEPNIFQHALERVEAARGVLQEARERVIPGSLTMRTEEKKIPEAKESCARVIHKEALSTSPRSDDTEKEGTPPPLPTRPLYTKPFPVSFPDKLHLSELEVERLNVSELQASKIKVSEIETASLDVTDINARSGNFTLSGVDLPPDFISNLVAQVVSQSQQQHISSLHKSRESTPQRQARTVLTPPPSIVVQATTEAVQLPEPIVAATEVTEHIPQPRTTRNRGRRSPTVTRVVDDSEDELATTMPTRSLEQARRRDDSAPPKPQVPAETPSVQRCEDPLVPTLVDASSLQLIRQLFSIWQDNITSGACSFIRGVNSLFPEGEKRRDAQIAGVILLILITGLILIGYGFDNSVHHHHWDYLPPR